MIWLPLIYLRPSTTCLCMRGCVTADLGKRQDASCTAPLFYEQTRTCPRIKISQFPSRDRTEDVRLRRTCKRSYYDWMPSDVIYYFPQLTYKARLCIPPQILSLHTFFCADRHHQGHRRRRPDPRGGRVLRRGLLLRDRRADPQRRHRLARRDQHPHLRDQLLHPPHQDARPVDRPPALHDTVHRARV
jgi:hypothetical protein